MRTSTTFCFKLHRKRDAQKLSARQWRRRRRGMSAGKRWDYEMALLCRRMARLRMKIPKSARATALWWYSRRKLCARNIFWEIGSTLYIHRYYKIWPFYTAVCRSPTTFGLHCEKSIHIRRQAASSYPWRRWSLLQMHSFTFLFIHIILLIKSISLLLDIGFKSFFVNTNV